MRVPLISEFRLYLFDNITNRMPSHTFRFWFYKNIMKFLIGSGITIFMNCSFDCARGFQID